MTKPKSNAGRKPIANPFLKLETRYFSMRRWDWHRLDAIALEHNCDSKDLVKGLIAMLLEAPENLTIEFDENTNHQA
jgi:hypothetical protein